MRTVKINGKRVRISEEDEAALRAQIDGHKPDAQMEKHLSALTEQFQKGIIDLSAENKKAMKALLTSVKGIKIEAPSVTVEAPKFEMPEIKIPKASMPKIPAPEVTVQAQPKAKKVKIDNIQRSGGPMSAMSGCEVEVIEWEHSH